MFSSKAFKKPLRLVRLKKENLKWETGCYPEVRCQAADAGTILSWLHWLLAESETEVPGYLAAGATAVWAAHWWMSIIMHGGLFLTERETRDVILLGDMFLNVYLQEASVSAGKGERLWRLRPKFHLIQECQVSLKRSISKRNPFFGMTWMDEDSLRKFMMIKSHTHKLMAEHRLIERLLEALLPKLKETLPTKDAD